MSKEIEIVKGDTGLQSLVIVGTGDDKRIVRVAVSMRDLSPEDQEAISRIILSDLHATMPPELKDEQ